jgi:hypothetical protein
MKKKNECLFYEDTGGHVGGGYSSPRVKGFTIPLPFEAANYGEAVKLVPKDVTASSVMQKSHVRVPDCMVDPDPMFRLPGEGFLQAANRILETLERTNDNLGAHPASQPNLYTVLDGVDMDGCSRMSLLKKKAATLVKWYRQQGLPQTSDLPETLKCGDLRKAVRSCFPEVSELWELSFKTIQKVENSYCSECQLSLEAKLDDWTSLRFQPVDVDQEHLLRFKQMLCLNVDRGWDSKRQPFIPNGHATLYNSRRDGGNWNREEFSDSCGVMTVISSGKPRIITTYSAENTRVLGPLHYSLYENLKKKGWLLVGDPTDKDIKKLTGTKYLSFDYQSATDMIKTAYVNAAVDVLIDRADGLTDDEIRALRVLGSLKIAGQDGVATRGQPMGSVMSFPLLCLINKTVVDLAMTDLLERKEISFREWSGHGCLINGDDLLTREVRHETNLRERICHQGSKVGLVVNQEKTMVDEQKAEINSTLFVAGTRQKKLNVSSLWMKPDVDDVLGFASEASVDRKSFVKIVRANAHILSKQQDKKLYNLSPGQQRACRRDKKIRRAITALPTSRRPVEEGVIRMSERPEGYDLSREEENDAMLCEIERVREMGKARCSERKAKFRTSFVPNAQSYSRATRRVETLSRELIPTCYVKRFYLKRWEDLVSQELADLRIFEDPPFDGPRISHMVDIIRAGKLSAADRTPDIFDDDLRVGIDYVSVDC